MTLVLGAMKEELAEVTARLEGGERSEWRGFERWRGRVPTPAAGGSDGRAHEVVVARTGVGKSLAALVTQHLMDELSPARVIVVGVAGALDPLPAIGDTLIVSEAVIHDMDATALGFARGAIPFSPFHVIACDAGLLSCARSVEPLSGRAHVGRILTGDQFVSVATVRDQLRESLHGVAVEMEAASIALVCAVNAVPCLIVKTISDLADGSAAADFPAILAYASRNAWHYLTRILAACREGALL